MCAGTPCAADQSKRSRKVLTSGSASGTAMIKADSIVILHPPAFILHPLFSRLLSIAETHPDRCAHKGIHVTNAILQIPFIGHVQQLGVVDEEQKHRWIGAHLSAIENLQTFSGMRGRRLL